MNLQQLSDRFAIRDMIVRYANALDSRRFEWLDEIFTPDAYVDYRATGGIDGSYPTIRAWLPDATGAFPHMCHLVGNIAVTLEQDRARARTLCLNPVEVPLPAGGSQVMFLAMWYADELVRTSSGWRMSRRVQEGSIQHNAPAHLTQMPNSTAR
jgi:SnoaL-like domain